MEKPNEITPPIMAAVDTSPPAMLELLDSMSNALRELLNYAQSLEQRIEKLEKAERFRAAGRSGKR